VKTIKYYLDIRAGGKLIFSHALLLLLYFPKRGFAAARIAVLAFKVVEIPA
jgi:hypothetical protein